MWLTLNIARLRSSGLKLSLKCLKPNSCRRKACHENYSVELLTFSIIWTFPQSIFEFCLRWYDFWNDSIPYLTFVFSLSFWRLPPNKASKPNYKVTVGTVSISANRVYLLAVAEPFVPSVITVKVTEWVFSFLCSLPDIYRYTLNPVDSDASRNVCYVLHYNLKKCLDWTLSIEQLDATTLSRQVSL